MARPVVYIVKVPKENGEYEETKHKNAKEVGAFLGVSERTIYEIVDGVCSYKRRHIKKIQNVIITKEEYKKIDSL